jgi:hypothetical protein
VPGALRIYGGKLSGDADVLGWSVGSAVGIGREDGAAFGGEAGWKDGARLLALGLGVTAVRSPGGLSSGCDGTLVPAAAAGVGLPDGSADGRAGAGVGHTGAGGRTGTSDCQAGAAVGHTGAAVGHTGAADCQAGAAVGHTGQNGVIGAGVDGKGRSGTMMSTGVAARGASVIRASGGGSCEMGAVGSSDDGAIAWSPPPLPAVAGSTASVLSSLGGGVSSTISSGWGVGEAHGTGVRLSDVAAGTAAAVGESETGT